jgi:hypothetical protein
VGAWLIFEDESGRGLRPPKGCGCTQAGQRARPGGVIPATGRSFSLPCAGIFQAPGPRFVSHRICWDDVTFLTQPGIMAASAGAGG